MAYNKFSTVILQPWIVPKAKQLKPLSLRFMGDSE